MKAVIFDLDGVLADTQKLHAQIETEIFGELGIKVTPEEMTKKFAGMGFKSQIKTVLSEYGKSADVDELDLEKYERYIKALQKGINSIKGSKPLVEWLHSKNIPIAVATSNKKKASSIILKELGLDNYIKTVVTSEDVEKGKPSPDIFLEAATKLGINPEDCIVIEDGESGIIGARKAKMTTIGFGKDVAGIGDYSSDLMDEIKTIIETLIH